MTTTQSRSEYPRSEKLDVCIAPETKRLLQEAARERPQCAAQRHADGTNP